MNAKRIKLYIENIENVLEMMKLELEKQEDIEVQKETSQSNTISLSEFLKNSHQDNLEDDVEYYEEPDIGANVLINSKEESDFYSNFRLGNKL